jgi:hypothetical protein
MLTKKKMKQSYDMVISRLESKIEKLEASIDELSQKTDRCRDLYINLKRAVEYPNGELIFVDEIVQVGEKITSGNKVHVIYYYVKDGKLKRASVGTFDKYFSEDDDNRYDLLKNFSYVKDTKEDIATIVIGNKIFYIDLK